MSLRHCLVTRRSTSKPFESEALVACELKSEILPFNLKCSAIIPAKLEVRFELFKFWAVQNWSNPLSIVWKKVFLLSTNPLNLEALYLCCFKIKSFNFQISFESRVLMKVLSKILLLGKLVFGFSVKASPTVLLIRSLLCPGVKRLYQLFLLIYTMRFLCDNHTH